MSLSQLSEHGFTKSLLVLIYTRWKPAGLPQFTNTKEPVVFIYHRGEVTRFWFGSPFPPPPLLAIKKCLIPYLFIP